MCEDSQIVLEEIVDHCHVTQVPNTAADIAFVEAIWPWVEVAVRRLEKRLGDLLSLLSLEAYSSLKQALAKRLSLLCSPTFYLEFQLKKCEFLFEKNEKDLYKSFIERYCVDPSSLKLLFAEYKDLGPLVASSILFWVERSFEMLMRLKQDLPLLEKIINRSLPIGTVSALSMDLGDVHNEGSAVSILSFASGKQIVYKPKNIQVVHFFQTFLDKVNSLGLQPPLQPYPVIAKDEYGWEEKIEYASCKTHSEVQRCYQRVGMYMCLMYLLDGIDVHFENIIIAGEHPFLIDLETLFHSSLPLSKQNAVSGMMLHSVLSTGLLPMFFFGRIRQQGIDVGSMAQGQKGLKLIWKNINSEEMEAVNEMVALSKGNNEVVLDGKSMPPADFVDEIISGFKMMYEFIQHHKELMSEEMIDSVQMSPVRIVIRPTRYYKYILDALRSPEVLASEEEKERILALLHKTFLDGEKIPSAIIEAETEMLLRGDIPSFQSRPGSTDLFNQSTLVIKNCFKEPSMKRVQHRFLQMGPSDLTLQLKLIRHAFYARFASMHSSSSEQIPGVSSKNTSTSMSYLNQAIAIGQEIKEHAIESDDGSLGWIHLDPNPYAEQYQLHPSSNTLYAGRIGIALFFAALAHMTHDPQWSSAATCTLIPLQKSIENKEGAHLFSFMGLGAMSGAGGLIYGLNCIGKLLNHTYLQNLAKQLAHSIEPRHISEDKLYDIMGGGAGLLLILLSLYKDTKDPHVLALAIQCGEHLCKGAEPKDEDKTLAWGGNDMYLLGLSHGTAGIAYALLKLNAFHKEERFVQTAQRALLYERMRYSPQCKNWPRYKQGYSSPIYTSSWCHGATGIGLTRLKASSFFTDPEMQQEIQSAIETTLAGIYASTSDLCCGLSGRIEFLREVAKMQQTPCYDSIIKEALEALLCQRSTSSKKHDFFNPGFMQGASGIGYTLLRSVDKEQNLPQVLLLDN